MANKSILPRFLLAGATALLLLAPAAGAQDGPTWSVNAGIANTHGDEHPFEAGLELRLRPRTKWNLVPAFGAAGTDEGSFWAYAGVRLDWEASASFLVTPQFAVVAYEKGDGFDLGGTLEFRSGLELAHRFESGARLGLLFFHLSHARLNGDYNPGSNSLVVTWTFAR